MVRSTSPSALFRIILLVLAGCASIVQATPPVLLAAVSRMSHGATAGSFDVQLPLSGGSGIECRNISAGMSIVMTFDQPVTGGTASVTAGATYAPGTAAISGSTITVPLSSVGNAQTFTVTLTNVTNAGSETLASASVPVRTLLGNVKGSGVVTGSDVNTVRAVVASGAAVSGANFRCDFNKTGVLTGSDVNIVRAQAAAGANIAGGATFDTAPTISAVANQTAVSGQASLPVGFTVGDAESNPSTLGIVVASSDQINLPISSLAISGSGTSRTLTITAPSGITTTAIVTVTLTASDGILTSTPTTFTVNVVPPPTVYLATLQPISGVASLGSGYATLVLSGDLTYATLTYSYSNLSGTDSDDAIYAPGDNVLFDISASHAALQANGSYLWTFKTTVTNSIAFDLQTIQSNLAYITIESSVFPAGELQGTFKLVSGSQTFTPPAAPPSFTLNPPTQADASRFLQQAGFGGKLSEINALSNASAPNASTAINDWLTAQFATQIPISPTYAAAGTPQANTFSSSSMYQQLYTRVTTAQPPSAYGDGYFDDRIHEIWWKNVITAPDQLRQRVATALSEHFVVSEIDTLVDDNEAGLCTYYDMLAGDAFLNFRQILGDVTLHPAMGEYLNMMANESINSMTSPNENYAREIMQLFTIGLYMLQPDGTLMLDQNGQPIPTYSQPTITQFAQVFTGWNQNGTDVVIPLLTSSGTQQLDTFWENPMVLAPITADYHSKTSKTLLNYPGAATYPGASQPAFIPATASQSNASATAELNFALDNIFHHPNVGPFVCKRLIQRLVTGSPSPAYVYRVAQIFNNDGTGTRGNMQAVITAILTDYEARSPNVQSDPGYGHAREPIIRIASLLRSLGGTSVSGKWKMGKTDELLAQTIFRSPTVFNFYDPSYTQPGVVQQAGLLSPEFEIIQATTVINSANMIYTGVYSPHSATGAPTGGTGFYGDGFSLNDVQIDFSATGSNLVSVAQNSGVGAMVDQVGLLLMGPPMPAAMRTTVVNFITANVSVNNYVGQVQAAVYLIASSSQCATEK